MTILLNKEPLPSHILQNIVSHLYRQPPPPGSVLKTDDLHQHPLTTMLRVNSVSYRTDHVIVTLIDSLVGDIWICYLGTLL
jgi:hypothetical protein